MPCSGALPKDLHCKNPADRFFQSLGRGEIDVVKWWLFLWAARVGRTAHSHSRHLTLVGCVRLIQCSGSLLLPPLGCCGRTSTCDWLGCFWSNTLSCGSQSVCMLSLAVPHVHGCMDGSECCIQPEPNTLYHRRQQVGQLWNAREASASLVSSSIGKVWPACYWLVLRT
jgi:hypothetical protein